MDPDRLEAYWGHLEVCHPCCVCENLKGYVVKHNYVK